ncbi:MAG: Uma2 family endonuclease [Dehalococcoidia bacterium]
MTTTRGQAVRGRAVYYRESDGKPMAESDTHRFAMMDAIVLLADRYADRDDVYVSGDILLYYEEGNPRRSIAPDVLVAFGVPKRPLRRIYRTWVEGKGPDVVFEMTSSSTQAVDAGRKPQLYARLGVQEYFLYDPCEEYLRPPLQGYRLVQGDYHPIPPQPDGSLPSATLDVDLLLMGGELRFRDRATGAVIPTRTERAETAERRATDAGVRAIQAEDRAIQAEDRAIQAEDRATQAEDRAEAEGRAIQAEDCATQAEGRATQAEDRC